MPVIANIRPSGDTYLMEDFFYAGGLPALMSRHRARTCKLDALTVTGRTLGENIAGAEVFNDDVIRPSTTPIYAEGALAVLRGNLAPDGLRHQAERLRAASCCSTPARRWCSTTIRR